MTPALELGDALFLDFDGSIVEIARTPESVEVAPSLPALLEIAAERLKGAVAVISGRPLEDLMARLHPYRGAAAGIHGLERRTASGVLLRPGSSELIDRARPMLAAFAAANPGVVLEDKGLAFALHYRTHPERAADCLKAARRGEQLSKRQLTVTQGKMVVELHPRAGNKGRAILEFLGEPPFRGRRPVFVGDDRTDEDGFAVINRLGGVSIRVGERKGSIALFDLPNVTAVIAWIRDFIPSEPAP
jgi:trehalose 6-phosphate phosphatase